MREDQLRRAFRQLFKLIRETKSQQADLLRLYLEILEDHRQLKARVDGFVASADPTRPVN